MKEERFYYQGVYYSTKEDFTKACIDYANSEVSLLSAERILDNMCKNILINFANNETNKILSNCDFQRIAEECLIFFISKYREY